MKLSLRITQSFPPPPSDKVENLPITLTRPARDRGRYSYVSQERGRFTNTAPKS